MCVLVVGGEKNPNHHHKIDGAHQGRKAKKRTGRSGRGGGWPRSCPRTCPSPSRPPCPAPSLIGGGWVGVVVGHSMPLSIQSHSFYRHTYVHTNFKIGINAPRALRSSKSISTSSQSFWFSTGTEDPPGITACVCGACCGLGLMGCCVHEMMRDT